MEKRKINIVLIVILATVFLTGCDDDNSVVLTKETDVRKEVTDSLGSEIYVYVSGEVEREGVYCVDSDTRLYQVIEQAGGFTKKAEKDCLNLAETVCDGQKIQVLSKKQYKEQKNSSVGNNDSSDSGKELLNINLATAEQLTNLPGIGSTKAIAIVTYREENGKFSSIEEIKKVSGIGDATFANIAAMITVN